MAPRWTAADDAAVSAAASARSGRAWPDWVDCPNRGRITADEASRRYTFLGKRPRPRGTIANVDVPVPESAAQRTRRMTPVHERAQNLGVVLKPTPEGLREAAASNFQLAGGADAKTVLHKHQKLVRQIVSRAEERVVRLRDLTQLQEDLRIRRRLVWNEIIQQSDDDGDAPGLCSAPSAAERLDFQLETRNRSLFLEREVFAELPAGERRFYNWLSLRKMQWRQMRQRRENEARQREEEARTEARRQQVALAAVVAAAAAAAAGDVNLPSGLLADFEFAVSVESAELKEFDEEEKAGEPLGYRSTIRNNRMRGWPLDELPKHMVEWRANLPLPAVPRWFEKSQRRSLENARKAASWDAAAIFEMRSKIPIGFWPRFARHIDALVLRFWERREGKRRE